MNNKGYYEYGIKQEKIIFETLKTKYPNLKQTEEKYSDWDFYDDIEKIKIELKSRRSKSNAYQSTILGSNKIFKGRKEKKNGYKVYYFFNFLDKIKYYRLSDNDSFKQSFFNEKYHTFIPNNKLKDF